MKKHMIAILSCIIAVFMLVGTTSIAFGAASPNDKDFEKISTYKYYGYIQCQPSYVDTKGHAVYGRFKFTQRTVTGTTIKVSDEIKTEKGKGPTDSRILSKNYTFTANSSANSSVSFDYGWYWYPDNGSWPFSLPEVPVTD